MIASRPSDERRDGREPATTAPSWTIWSASPARSVRNRTAITLLLMMLGPSGPLHAQSMPAFGTVPPDTALFAYDDTAPLEVEFGETADRDGYRRTAIAWASPDGGRVPAWLYLPEGEGPHPAILMQHGMPGTRSTLHPLAEAYARAGALVLAPTAPFGRPDPLFVARAAPARLRFDVGVRDELVPLSDALALASAAREPKVVERWEAGHALVPEAYAAQARWLAPILGIDPERFVAPDFRKDRG